MHIEKMLSPTGMLHAKVLSIPVWSDKLPTALSVPSWPNSTSTLPTNHASSDTAPRMTPGAWQGVVSRPPGRGADGRRRGEDTGGDGGGGGGDDGSGAGAPATTSAAVAVTVVMST